MPDKISQISGKPLGKIYKNLPVPTLYEHSLATGKEMMDINGSLVAMTGSRTGRSAGDKFVVEEPGTKDKIWWGKVNQPLSEKVYDHLFKKMTEYLAGKDLYVLDAWAGAHPKHRLGLRVISEIAWHNLFARQLFIRTTPEEQKVHQPEWKIYSAPNLKADPAKDGTKSEVAVCLHFGRKEILIIGTHYAGEMKKGIFTVLNYLLPQKNILPMHCSANIGKKKDVALFFGLSGTGKTSLSADPIRDLIGDDEHGWGDDGVFNFEGGCYAKCIRLSKEKEPQIWNAIRFGSVIENVVVDPATRIPKFEDGSVTENTRVAYPLDFIENAVPSGMGGTPNAVIFLSCDAFGVLPPMVRLSPEQAMYHFMSGYTSAMAGTEAGTGKEPKPTFSACFGAPFLPLPPTTYAKMLSERLQKNKIPCWLINTGWHSGPADKTKRIPIAYNRASIAAILSGELSNVKFIKDPVFGFEVPEKCSGIPDQELQPRKLWSDAAAYDATIKDLASRFKKNFEQFTEASADIVNAGPKA
jgi:phosphoenolpyruvate carboxykinase (ATP)